MFSWRSGCRNLPALDLYVLSESQIFSLPARPNSVNNELYVYGNELQCVLTQFCIFNSFSCTFSQGKEKIKNTVLIKDHFLSLEIHLGTYINLYSFERSLK